jgi:hypothetical protein
MVGLVRASERRAGEFQPYRLLYFNALDMSEKKYRLLLADLIQQVERVFNPGDNISLLFFAIGNFILENEARREYGKETLYRLFRDLTKYLVFLKGMSMPHPRQMRKVAAAYRRLDGPLPGLGLKWLTWEHHVKLVAKVKQREARLFYLELAYRAELTCEEMVRRIDSGLYERFDRRQLSQIPQSPASLSPK